MYGVRTQVPTVVQRRLFLLVEARVTDAGLRYSITLALVLSYLRPYLQRCQNLGPQASTGQEQRCHSVGICLSELLGSGSG